MDQATKAELGVLDLSPIRVQAIYPPVCIDVDLYLPASPDQPSRLYAAVGTPPTADDLDRLITRGVTTLFVPCIQADFLRRQLRELIDSAVAMPPNIRLEVAREAVKGDIAHAWRCKEPSALVEHAAEFSQQIVDICQNQEGMTSQLASLAAHDGDTFAHISNVCTYAVMLAQSLGITNNQTLLKIGQAALLHDLGKRSIHSNILKKPGRLTDSEREIMQDHPRKGFVELCGQEGMSQDQLLMIYQHHEKLDGSGYPVRLVGDEINWMAQLCAVVDVFDALTARRCYRQSAAAESALEIIGQGAGNHFSIEYVQCWKNLVSSTMPIHA
jgi:HD-GYP domain-containing protein (c-di-GMP phosphodiesterase class II)